MMSEEPTAAGLPPDLPGLCVAITGHAPLPIATVDGATHILRYANPAFCLLMDEPLERLVGRPLQALLPARDECVTLLDRVFRTGRPERHIQKEDAKPHPVFWSYTIWPMEADGHHVGIMIQVTESGHFHETAMAVNEALLLGAVRQHQLTDAAEDVSARLREEIAARAVITAELSQKARELAEKARLLDLTHDAIIVRDMEGRIRYWNHGAEDLYGWSREEAMGKVSHLLLQTEFPVPVEQMLAELHRNDRWIGELVHTASDGRRLTVLARKTLDRDGEGRPAAVLENLTDITARKRAEQALQASQSLFSSLVEKAPFGMYVVDDHFRLQQVNTRALPMLGNVVPLVGRDFTEVVTVLWGKEVGGRLADIFRHTLETGERYVSPPFTEQRRDLDVEESYEWEVQRFTLPDGHYAVVCYFADISERHALERSIADRAADLVRADRSKDEFLGMLAHELRNPLAPLRSATEILQTRGVTAEATGQAVDILSRQIDNMSEMIDDLLDVSRITEGKIELRLEEVALEAVLEAAASLAERGIQARGQEITISLPAEPVFLRADATRLDQVFGNLLTNACKYSGRGCHISLSAERAEPRGEEPPEVIVRVRDDGIGIAPELLPRIFDLFVQANRSLDRAHGGLGIGLTLVQRLVKLHGGSVEAHSEGLGHGSEFTVRLPILTTAAEPAPPPAAENPDTPRRILIVDDNEDSAWTMATLQSMRGHETRTAFTGPDAVAAAAEFLPDVVLLDIGLPGMDGYQVARQLRAMPALAGTFVVAMTGYGRDEDRALTEAAGFDRHMVKPVDLELLRQWLSERP
jgi:PAS domain S-box-containing protein